jgi:CarboxypepD_reg-like domain
MQKIHVYFLSFWFLLALDAAAQKNRTLYGKVIDEGSQQPINSVTIINKRTKQRAVSNSKGDFFIWAAPNDSINVIAVGYKNNGILWDGKSNQPTITMKLEAIALQEVIIREKRIENLEKEIKDFLDNPYGSKEVRQEIMRSMLSTQNLSQPGIGISIDALYDMFSKEGKARQKVADLKMEEARKFYVSLRYNKKLVGHITGLKDTELNDFMNFCSLNDDFVLRATDYDLTYKIFQCYDNFKR